MPNNPLTDTRPHSDFGGRWVHVTNPTEIAAILATVNVPLQYNQLMVAKDPNGAFYCVYGAGNPRQHTHRGWFGQERDVPIEDTPPVSDQPIESTPHAPSGPLEESPTYHLLYNRGDYPIAFEK